MKSSSFEREGRDVPMLVVRRWTNDFRSVPWDPYLVWAHLTDALRVRLRSEVVPARIPLLVETTDLPALTARAESIAYGPKTGAPLAATHAMWLEVLSLSHRHRTGSSFLLVSLADISLVLDFFELAASRPALGLRLEVSASRAGPLDANEKDRAVQRLQKEQAGAASLSAWTADATEPPLSRLLRDYFEARDKEPDKASLRLFRRDLWRSLAIGRPDLLSWQQVRPPAFKPEPLPFRRVHLCVADDRFPIAAYSNGEIVSLWDQTQVGEDVPFTTREPAPSGRARFRKRAIENRSEPGGPRRLRGAGYGRLLDSQEAHDPDAQAAVDEPGEYRECGYFHPVRRWSHGSAVLGRIAPPRRCSRLAPLRASVQLVQLDNRTVLDTSGGSLAAYALDAILDALEQAPERSEVVVNLSFGTHAGPHDGTSMTERALRHLLDLYDGHKIGKRLWLVLPAGNTMRWRCHRSAVIGGGQGSCTMHVKAMPDNPEPVFVETWISPRPEAGELEVRVRTPTGLTLQAGPGSIAYLDDDSERLPYAALVFGKEVVQGRKGTMALLAIGATNPDVYLPRPADARSSEDPPGRAPHGLWTLEVRVLRPDSRRFEIDAWVQRADAAPGRSRDEHGFDDRQSHFVELERTDVEPAITLNGIATFEHERLFVVGAMRELDRGLSTYSAAGPQRGGIERFEGPDVVEVADHSHALPGMLTTGALGGSRLRVGGTSLAAAAFTRRLVRLLEAGGDPAVLKTALAPNCPTADPPVTPADPELAPAYHRGEHRRLPPDEPDGRP